MVVNGVGSGRSSNSRSSSSSVVVEVVVVAVVELIVQSTSHPFITISHSLRNNYISRVSQLHTIFQHLDLEQSAAAVLLGWRGWRGDQGVHFLHSFLNGVVNYVSVV